MKLFFRRVWVYSILYVKRFFRKVLKLTLTLFPHALLLRLADMSGASNFRQSLSTIQKKDLEELTAYEKWQKLLCECLTNQDSKGRIKK